MSIHDTLLWLSHHQKQPAQSTTPVSEPLQFQNEQVILHKFCIPTHFFSTFETH